MKLYYIIVIRRTLLSRAMHKKCINKVRDRYTRRPWREIQYSIAVDDSHDKISKI